MNENSTSNWQDNTGHNVFAAQGSQTIYLQKLEDRFQDGIEALKNRLYPKVVERFEDYLSTATSPEITQQQGRGDGEDSDREFTAAASLSRMTALSQREIESRMATAHVYAAIGLLNGTAPSYRRLEVIHRIDQHLELARKLGSGQPPHAQASVVWAIVKDDYYDFQGMPAPDPQADELRRSIADLDRADIGVLVEHLAPAQGETWRQLARQANEYGFAVAETLEEDTRRTIPPGRAEAVRKYFIRNPDPVSPVPHVLALGGVALLLILGLASQNVLGFLALAAVAIWPGKFGVRRLRAYLKYQKDLAEAEPKPSDEQMNAWLSEDTEYIKRKAARRLLLNARLQRDGGDLVVPEQIVVGIPQPSEPGAGRLKVRWGADGQLRANHYTVLILFLTERMISTYRCLVDFGPSDLILDETHEYHYTDIVGVSSSSIPVSGQMQELVEVVAGPAAADISLFHQFSLSVVSGESLRVVTGFGGRFEQAGGTVVWRGNENALKIVQNQVRSRHSQ